MADTTSARQQIAEKIKDTSTVLVTVGKDPSVDELSAALGLTMMLNSLNKHATAVVSGAIPPAIEFLEPGKTFEHTVDSLRDFIIALDKEKADHLRYKVEGDVVKIFITPYRTKIDEKDLEFTQGDYNVELVLALGVKNQDDLDTALEAHGKILHDATVATISATETSSLGSIDWNDAGASSICEMLVSLSEAIKSDKAILDEQSATALLTGIVATTDRFSNNKTSSKVMTMAAQLMAAGANQQLIAAKLEEAHEIGDNSAHQDGASSSTSTTSSGEVTEPANDEQSSETIGADGSLAISHEREGDIDEVAREVRKENQESAAEKAEDALATQLENVSGATSSPISVTDLQKDIAQASSEIDKSADDLTPVTDRTMPGYEPTMGGTLNATTEKAAADKRLEEEKDQNRAILSHPAPIPSDSKPLFATPLNASQQPDEDETAPGLPSMPKDDDSSTARAAAVPVPELELEQAGFPPLPHLPSINDIAPAPTLAEIDEQNRNDEHNDAMADVHAAFGTNTDTQQPVVAPTPLPPLPSPDAVPSGLPPLPDFSAPPPPPPAPVGAPVSPPVFPAPSDAPTSALPVAQPPEQLGQIFGSTPSAVPLDTAAPQPNDPAQFKIPGQS